MLIVFRWSPVHDLRDYMFEYVLCLLVSCPETETLGVVVLFFRM